MSFRTGPWNACLEIPRAFDKAVITSWGQHRSTKLMSSPAGQPPVATYFTDFTSGASGWSKANVLNEAFSRTMARFIDNMTVTDSKLKIPEALRRR